MRRFLPFLLLIFLNACNDLTTGEMMPTMAFAPVYAAMQWDATVEMQPSKPTATAGKIYAYRNYAFQVDQYTGIHIIENASTAGAKKIGFLQIPFCTEIAIRNNYLYTNHNNDIVVFDLSDPAAPRLANRLKEAFPAMRNIQEHPPFSGVYFECPDPAKGMVIDWVQKTIESPNCRR